MDEMDSKIRDARRRLRMTQGEFASALGVTQSSVSRWESGAQTPDIASIVKLAKLVGSDPDEFTDLGSARKVSLSGGVRRNIYVSGQIAENAYSSQPDTGGTDFLSLGLESFDDLNSRDLTAFEIIDSSGLPTFSRNTVIIVDKNYGVLIENAIVVVTLGDEQERFRNLIKRVYIDTNGDVILASLNPDPAYYNIISLRKNVSRQTSSSLLTVTSECIRGVVVASLTRHNPSRPDDRL